MRTTHKQRFDQITHQVQEVRRTLADKDMWGVNSWNTLRASVERLQFIRTSMAKTERRAIGLLNMALEVADMKQYIGEWELELILSPNDVAAQPATLRFRLIIPKNKPYKGAWKTCPLLKIMNMEFPTAWLDARSTNVRKEMIKLLHKP